MVKDKWDGIMKKRTSLMGAFHRLDILLTQEVYEFCDLFIKTGLEYTTDEDIKEKFNVNLYRDVSDLYGKNNSQRQYYTMPNTQIPNKQREFAELLYKTDKTCKEDGIKCASYIN